MRSKEEFKSFISKELAGNSLARKICEVDKLATFFEWPTEVKPITIEKEAIENRGHNFLTLRKIRDGVTFY